MTSPSSLRLGDQVTLHYRLTCAGETVVDTFAEGPETFTLGQGEIAPRLESLLLGLHGGDRRLFELAADEAFGAHDPDMVHDLPRGDFPAAMELNEGCAVEFELPNGQTLIGTLLALDDERARVDFNHPLAGLPVNFEVHILAIVPK